VERTSGGLPDYRVAVVTGGSRGVGAIAVERLADLGYAVVVDYAHDQRAADSTVERILARRGSAVAIRADVVDELDMERLFIETKEMFGAIDAVVHTVRGRVLAKSVGEVSLDEFETLCRMNLRATLIVNALAARHLRDGGAIVNVITTVGDPALPYYGAQATVSAAVEALTRVLAVELRERQIVVNAISLEVDRRYAPGAIADLITYLVSEDGRAVTGQLIDPESDDVA
jgi:3-oxoacyl-[acyl-carrier protein] reductase